MKITPITVILVLAGVAAACSGENQIRCTGDNDKIYDYWQETKECMQELGNTATCHCWRRAREYVVAENNMEAFKRCCSRKMSGKQLLGYTSGTC